MLASDNCTIYGHSIDNCTIYGLAIDNCTIYCLVIKNCTIYGSRLISAPFTFIKCHVDAWMNTLSAIDSSDVILLHYMHLKHTRH